MEKTATKSEILTVLAIGLIAIAVGIFAISSNKSAQASGACGTSKQVTGTGWSENIGWIVFGNGGGILCEDSEGHLVGHGWSENIGWIQFGNLSGFLNFAGTPQVNAYFDGDNILRGWARACAGTVRSDDSYLSHVGDPNYSPDPNKPGNCSTMVSRPDGWDGWISLGSSTGLPYGTPVYDADGDLTTYSWGGEVVGWIQWKLDTRPPTPTITEFTSECLPGELNYLSVSWNPPLAPYDALVGSYSISIMSATSSYTYFTQANISPADGPLFTVETTPSYYGGSYKAQVFAHYTFGDITSSLRTHTAGFCQTSIKFSCGGFTQGGTSGNSTVPPRPLVGRPIQLSLRIEGGTPPYSISMSDQEGTYSINGIAGGTNDPALGWITNVTTSRVFNTVGEKYIYATTTDSNGIEVPCPATYLQPIPLLKVAPRYQEY